MGLFSIFNKKDKKEFKVSIAKKLPVGDTVKLWVRPNTNVISVYEYGYTGGKGLLAEFRNKIIATHLLTNKAFTVEVVSSYRIMIKLLEMSNEEFLDEEYIKNTYGKIVSELSKATRVKKITMKVMIVDDSKVVKGDKLIPVFLSNVEEHAKKRILSIDFKDINNNIIGNKESEPTKIKQLLRAHFVNNVELDCTVARVINFGDRAEFVVDIELIK